MCVRVCATVYAHKGGWVDLGSITRNYATRPPCVRALARMPEACMPPQNTHSPRTHARTHARTHTHTPAVGPLPQVSGINSGVEPPHNALALHDLNRRIREAVVLLGAACSAVNLGKARTEYKSELKGLSLEYARNRLIPHVLTCQRTRGRKYVRNVFYCVSVSESENVSETGSATHPLPSSSAGHAQGGTSFVTCICTRITSRGWQQVAAPIPAKKCYLLPLSCGADPFPAATANPPRKHTLELQIDSRNVALVFRGSTRIGIRPFRHSRFLSSHSPGRVENDENVLRAPASCAPPLQNSREAPTQGRHRGARPPHASVFELKTSLRIGRRATCAPRTCSGDPKI